METIGSEPGNGLRDDDDDGRLKTLAEFVRGAGQRANGWSFGAYKVADDYQRDVFAMVKKWADSFEERLKAGEGLVLYGPAGTGKDHLAFAAVAKSIVTFGVSARWFSCRDVFGAARDQIGSNESESALLRSITRASVVVLSDPLPPFGDVALTPWQSDLLFRIVDARWRRQLPTVCTVNVADDDEGDRRLGAPTWDRINDRAWRAFTRWPSYRQPAVDMRPRGTK